MALGSFSNPASEFEQASAAQHIHAFQSFMQEVEGFFNSSFMVMNILHLPDSPPSFMSIILSSDKIILPNIACILP